MTAGQHTHTSLLVAVFSLIFSQLFQYGEENWKKKHDSEFTTVRENIQKQQVEETPNIQTS